MMPLIEHKITKDGSSTLYSSKYDQHYHSVHGAINESMHVFIDAGLKALVNGKKVINVLEMGFGTGLNALLTFVHRGDFKIRYTTIEAEPVAIETVHRLNYSQLIQHPEIEKVLTQLHQSDWNHWITLTEDFNFYKYHGLLQDFKSEDRYDVIFFDAFAPNSQPELWTPQIFARLYEHSAPGAIITTYSAKGDVRRALKIAGYQVEKLPGPPGKREMLRGRKNH